ncbi:MAG: hypothetical protein K8H85_04480, partial [Cyclobacteriaceae bacterium]|nr:hypothetical protein [Cyclobacteriaceae bacterium]
KNNLKYFNLFFSRPIIFFLGGALARKSLSRQESAVSRHREGREGMGLGDCGDPLAMESKIVSLLSLALKPGGLLLFPLMKK